MHKNAYHAKSLIGNWHEERHTDKFDEDLNVTSNTHVANPCKSILAFLIAPLMDSSQQIRTHF